MTTTTGISIDPDALLEVCDDLRGLAEALERLLDDQDGRVSAMFDLLRMGTVS